ncbi:MAG: hypothetical protein M0036_25870 [Desulfobacteraceae bacterium]|nr:hypothetical protein [Desulfobacteraceae bacterium]
MSFGQKRHFLRRFRERFALRFHMTIILVATACSGVFASKLFLSAGISNFLVRYPLSVVFAYLVFFLCIKLWLIYMGPKKQTRGSDFSNTFDLLDLPGSGSRAVFRAGGGHFGGGGASSSFELPASGIVGEGGSGAAESLGDAVGEAAGAIGDEGGIAAVVVVACLAAIIATILGASIYMIYEAPVILSEAAFEAFLAATLLKSTKKIYSGDWLGSIFAATWKPFLITFIMALAAGGLLHYYFPEAHKVAEIIQRYGLKP